MLRALSEQRMHGWMDGWVGGMGGWDGMGRWRDGWGACLSQLIRRNEELATLYEKIKIQRTTLKKCEALYKSRSRASQTTDINDTHRHPTRRATRTRTPALHCLGP